MENGAVNYVCSRLPFCLFSLSTRRLYTSDAPPALRACSSTSLLLSFIAHSFCRRDGQKPFKIICGKQHVTLPKPISPLTPSADAESHGNHFHPRSRKVADLHSINAHPAWLKDVRSYKKINLHHLHPTPATPGPPQNTFSLLKTVNRNVQSLPEITE